MMDKITQVQNLAARYEVIFNNSPLGICISEINGNINVNNTFCDMLGYTKSELIEAGWKDITYRGDINKYHEIFNIFTSKNSEPIKLEKRFIKKDGSIIWTEVTSKLITDEVGEPLYLISMIRDITQHKHIEEKLSLNEARYLDLFSNNPNPMWVYDLTSLNFLMVNDAASIQYGYSQDEFLKMSLNDIWLFEENHNQAYVSKIKDSSINTSATWKHRKKDGTIILVKISSNRIKLNGYSAQVVMALDVTEKVADKNNLVTEVAKLKSIIESTSDAIFSVDRNYCFTSFNSMHFMVMKEIYNANIQIGKNFLDYLQDEQERTKAKNNIDRALKGERFQYLSIYEDSPDTHKYIDILHNPIKNEYDEVIGVSIFAKDISESKKFEQDLIEAKLKAEEINRVKSIFFSNMSHELRTPLVGILGFADLLFNNLDEEEQRLMAKSILKSGKRLLNTLTSLLSLTELESIKKELNFTYININEFCKDLINIYKSNSKNAAIEFKTELEPGIPDILLNERLLRESFSHILNNSIQYTESGFILVKTFTEFLSKTNQKILKIEISDTGIGIPKEKQKIIFEEFRQVSEGYGRNFEGTGLGLTITKKYTELLGGTVELESEVDKGTKIIFSFPITDNSENIISQPTVSAPTVSENNNTIKTQVNTTANYNKSILVVEDDSISRAFLSNCLSKICKYKCVDSGAEAIKSATEDIYDLIFMDINLGNGIDGVTATQAIRKINGYDKTVIVAMTAFAEEEARREFLAKGCTHYLAKPFLKNDLIALIDNIFKAAK